MTIIFDALGSIFYDDEEDLGDELPHPCTCCCEDCLQNYPERDVLYNDSQYYGDDDDEDLTDDEG